MFRCRQCLVDTCIADSNKRLAPTPCTLAPRLGPCWPLLAPTGPMGGAFLVRACPNSGQGSPGLPQAPPLAAPGALPRKRPAAAMLDSRYNVTS